MRGRTLEKKRDWKSGALDRGGLLGKRGGRAVYQGKGLGRGERDQSTKHPQTE